MYSIILQEFVQKKNRRGVYSVSHFPRFPMSKRVSLLIPLIIALSLIACTSPLPPEEEGAESVSSESSLLTEEELVTRNVTYTGLLEEGGVTIYQQGTHRLTLADGKMVILEPSTDSSLSLDLYAGKYVEVKGDVRPTVEAGGTLMEVSSIVWIRRETDADGKEVEMRRVLCGSGTACPEGFTCLLEETPGICVEESSSSSSVSSEESSSESSVSTSSSVSSSSSSSSVSSVSSASSSSVSSASSSSMSSEGGVSASAGVDVMAKEDISAGRWTQQYCSTHIGFCIPVHKNWYFKSFGATTSSLWHVEVGAGPIEVMGEGPIVLELKNGDVTSVGATDGAVIESGGKVTGYRTWSDNRHFELSADASLKGSVEIMLQGLKAE